jgi:DNA-binding transcriptional MerR regulator
MSDIPSSSWVTVAEAAERAGVDTGTVRQWYRAGRIPTRRAEGERGAFLVPLAAVLELVPSSTAAAVPSEGPASSELLQQVDFLRTQLAELSEENRVLRQRLQDEDDRRADLRARLADTEDELNQLRRTAARSSITDPSWLDEQTPAYESPVRPQGMGSAARAVPRTGELADLLAATRPDGEDDGLARRSSYEDDGWATPAAAHRPSVGPHTLDDQDEDVPFVPPRPIPAGEAAGYGTHEDDLLPEPDKRGRRAR